MSTLERNLQKSVLNHLKKLRQNDQSLVFRKRHGSAMGLAGDPDLYGVYHGTHFEIELKRPGEEPSKLQSARLQEWAAAGALCTVVHSTAELAAFLEHLEHASS